MPFSTITIQNARFVEEADLQCIAIDTNKHRVILNDSTISNCGQATSLDNRIPNIQVNRARGIELDRVVSANSGGDGLSFVESSMRVTIENSKFVRNRESGLKIDVTKLELTIRGSKFNSNGELGVNIVKSRKALLEDVQANNNGFQGISVDARNFFTARNVLAVGNSVVGIEVIMTQLNNARFVAENVVSIGNTIGIHVRGSKQSVRVTLENVIACSESGEDILFDTDIALQSDPSNISFKGCSASGLILDVNGNIVQDCQDIQHASCDGVCGTSAVQ
ncbi:MAG: hypothetical protein SGILL_006433 [Bacillariaceae sp.]